MCNLNGTSGMEEGLEEGLHSQHFKIIQLDNSLVVLVKIARSVRFASSQSGQDHM